MKRIYLLLFITLLGCSSNKSYINGQQLEWAEAKSFINSKPTEIDDVFQAHSLHINILLKNGDVLKTKESYIDEIFAVLRKCGVPCKHIGWITE